MLVIAILLRPWHLLAKVTHVIPRALADDLLLLATGDYVIHAFENGMNMTCKFLHDIGAKIAPDKCKVFASKAMHKNWLASKVWEPWLGQIPVVN
eukprot:773365-Karenia_brevis.AAC.1